MGSVRSIVAQCKYGPPVPELWVRGVLETLPTVQAIAIAPDSSQELGGKTLLQTIPYTEVTACREIKMALNRTHFLAD